VAEKHTDWNGLYRGKIAKAEGQNYGEPTVDVVEGRGTDRYSLTHERGFQWGYDGSGPARLAEAILADSWPYVHPRPPTTLDDLDRDYRVAIITAFRSDHLEPLEQWAEFVLPRSTVTRWIAGFIAASCETCGGRGVPNTTRTACTDCDGTGRR